MKLHWANADQYYIKTTENYASYAFVAGRGDAAFRVRFEIAAADNEKDNVKETDGRQRRFLLENEPGAVARDGADLVVRFEHRPLTDGEKKTWPGNGATRIGDALHTPTEWENRGVYFLHDSGWPQRMFGHVLGSAL